MLGLMLDRGRRREQFGLVAADGYDNSNDRASLRQRAGLVEGHHLDDAQMLQVRAALDQDSAPARRSEEHTSELQSLMRISYAVFCLKKKKHQTQKHTHTQNGYANVTQQHEQD